jgi:branched-chain amino acid transport system ATP-binding protein/branched-chain amino acid transport system permease protein
VSSWNGHSAAGSPVLEGRNLAKQFGGIQAVDDVSLHVSPGEILALIGPNGAGKSTLINLLGGLMRPDSGTIWFDGADVTRQGVEGRSHRGLLRTYQHVHAFRSFTVRDALRLSGTTARARRSGDLVQRTVETAARFGITDSMDRELGELSYGVQKVVNLALVSMNNPKALLLDEPFAGITKEDVLRLSTVIKSFAEQGVGVCIVEHDMEAVLGLCDRVEVLDVGRTIFRGTPEAVRGDSEVRRVYLGDAGADAPQASATADSGGRAVATSRPGERGAAGRAELLTVSSLRSGYGQHIDVLRGVEMVVRRGELVAIVGPNGAGKTTLLKTICGLVRSRSGTVLVDSVDLTRLPIHSVVKRGVIYVPEGREVFAPLTVAENLRLGAFSRPEGQEEIWHTVLELFPRLAERLSQRAGSLSGGEQQMLAIGRGLMSQPKLLLVDEPTLGLAPVLVDALGDWLAEVRDRLGTTVIIAEQSAKLARGLCDRMYVLVGGRVLAERGKEGFSDEELFAMYLGADSSTDSDLRWR